MDTWLAQTPALIAAFAVLSGLGVVLVAPLRFSRLATLALAPLASVAVLSVLAIVLGWLNIGWNVLSVLAGCAVFAGILWALRLVIGRADQPVRIAPRARIILVAGLVVGAAAGALRAGFYIGDALAISQTNDAVFHLNALRYALETGSVSSFDISAVIDAASFYPAGWHAVVLAVAQFSGATLPAAINAVSLAIVVAVWVPGLAWLTREAVVRIRPERASMAAAFAAALASSLLAFPLLLLQWGVLYPNALSIALVPAAAAMVPAAAGWVDAAGVSRRRTRIIVLVVLFAAAAAAIGLAQPASLLAWLILVASYLTWTVLRRPRGQRGAVWRSTLLPLLAVWGGSAAIWILMARTSPGAHWGTFESEGRAVLDVLTNRLVELPAQYAVSVLMIIGLIVSVRVRELRWLAMSWMGFAGLYIITAAIDQARIRHYAVGAWYADPYRLAAMIPIAVIPLAAIALAWVVGAVSDRRPLLARRDALALGALALIAAVQAALLAIVPVTQLPLITEHITDTKSRYAIDGQTYLSTDERTLLERLPEELPDGARIIGNPSTGMGFAFALSGVDAFPRTWSPPSSDDWTLLAEHLRDASTMPAVCDALAVYGDARYVLDFGPGETTSGRFKMPGFTDFAGQPGFTLIDSEGDASVWRIDAC
ncbi:DUF6541 family protein [Streptomyces sp. AC495_CC817]|uniref:DUF6541 family protein n=1 Tax=Streptomyces sp. AC495_CC817 TaxID=2823900 RepID=UPI001C25E6BD|nr:DUF6541 family protein [Streptomyces sp. AC495_CC817]